MGKCFRCKIEMVEFDSFFECPKCGLQYKKYRSVYYDHFFEDKKKYFDVIFFFDYVLKSDDYKSIIVNLSKGIGLGTDGRGCHFPDSEDVDDEGYFENSVYFYSGCPGEETDIYISYEMFVRCVELSYSIYLESHEKDDDIENAIKKMHDKSISIQNKTD